jgi:hypothetical protein
MQSIGRAAVVLCITSCAAYAAPVNGNGNVTPDAIFGGGNANGSYTGVNENNVELGLRGKLRYNPSGVAENTFNYDNDMTYSFDPSDGVAPANRSLFNFEFSINSDADGTSGRTLDELSYLIEIDSNPTAGTNFFSYDVINLSPDPKGIGWRDHSIGDNSTANGGGAEAFDLASYLNLIGGNNVAQQSWNMGFTGDTGFNIDPQTEGLYTIRLSAFDPSNQSLLATTAINIRYGAVPPVPLPATLPLLAAALGGVGVIARRRKG